MGCTGVMCIPTLNILESWFKSLPPERMFAAIEFDKVDTELELPSGTAYKLLKKSVNALALNGQPIQVKRDGDSVILFQLGKRHLKRASICEWGYPLKGQSSKKTPLP